MCDLYKMENLEGRNGWNSIDGGNEANRKNEKKGVRILTSGLGWTHQSPNFKTLRSPRIDSKESIPPTCVASAGIFKQSMGARNQVGKGLSYRPAMLLRPTDPIPWNRFLGCLKV
jgi:hypothetical protein